jgi:hypothetical protein
LKQVPNGAKKHDMGWFSVWIFLLVLWNFDREWGGGATFNGHTKPESGKQWLYFSFGDFVYITACIQLHFMQIIRQQCLPNNP